MTTNNDSSLAHGSSSKKRKSRSGDSADEGDQSTRTSPTQVRLPSLENGGSSSLAPPEAVVGSSKKRKTPEDNDADFVEGSSTARNSKAPKSSNADSAAGESDSDLVPLRKRSTRTSPVPVQFPDPENGNSSSLAPPETVVGSSKKRKTPEDNDADFVEGSSTAKRARTPHSVEALAAPIDKGILGLAVELFCQICYELRPFDLIILSRVCTTFHSFLYGPSSAIIWRTARIANNIPNFPSKLNISEQSFAEIVFGESCHFCGKIAKPGTTMERYILWTLGKAVCEDCNNNTLIGFEEFGRSFPVVMLDIIPHTATTPENLRFVRELANEYLVTYEELPDEDARCEWRNRKGEEQHLIDERVLKCERWLQKYKERMAKERMNSILNELKRRGWALEMASIGSKRGYGYLKIERDSKLRETCENEISERALQDLYKHLLKLLGAERARRLKKERNAMLKHRLTLLQELHKSCVSQLPANTLVPSTADIFMLPAVKELIEDSPNEGEFTLANLNSIKESFEETSTRWASEIKAKLFAMMHGRTPPNAEDELQDIDTVLNLATTFFICSFCCPSPAYRDHEASYRYKRTIMHACAGKSVVESSSKLAEPFQTLHRHLKILPWNHSEKISFDTDAYHFMRELLTICGLDPDRTTAKEMHALNPIFECLRCNSPFRGRCTMTWEGAVKHHGPSGPHPVTGKPGAVAENLSLVLLDESEVELVQARMAEELARRRASQKYSGLCCSVCKVKGNSAQLGDANLHKCGDMDMQTNRKLVPCLDRRQYPVEYWIWPPRNAGQMEIAPALD